jgi:Cu(I)/Ag(I) efflux system membrane fusion protein
MNSTVRTIVIAVLLAVALAAGYLLGKGRGAGSASQTATSPASSEPAAAAKPSERKILYFRNPMGLPDTSPVPKKDPMGMDYIAVYEGEDQGAPGTVKVSADRIQTLGVRTESVSKRSLARVVRAVGTIEISERGQHTVSPKFEGWIEKLHVNTTGQAVARGQPLAEVYSPELVSAQREYLIAYNATKNMSAAGSDAKVGMQQLATASLERLRNWDISEQQLVRLREGGEPRRTLTLTAPASGVILKDPPVAGMRFMPGEALFKIADLSRVWLIADVFEQDLSLVRIGTRVSITVSVYSDKAFPGEVTFIYPTLNTETRTARVRIELANPQGQLKPGMYGTVQIEAGPKREVVTVPDSAVIDSGTRQVVLVALGEGRFEPRDVKLGSRGEGFVEVLSGVKDGETVVTRANFLIDSESNLKAALSGFSADKNASGSGAAGAASGEGAVVEIDVAGNKITLDHDPIPALKWSRMEMEFRLEPRALPKNLKPGDRVRFDMKPDKPGEYVITKIEAIGAPKPVTVAPVPSPASAVKPEAHKN